MISIISFIYQYNGKNKKFFDKHNDKHQKKTVGRIIEMLPLAVVGFSFASSGILEFFKKYILQTIIVCTNIIYFLLFYNIFSKIEGYEFGGIQMFFVSICIFIIFAILPPEKMKNTILLKMVKQITNYTAGIYFIHMSIRNYLQPYIGYVKNKTMKGCIIVYLISYFICFFGNLIFGKTRLRNLFV